MTSRRIATPARHVRFSQEVLAAPIININTGDRQGMLVMFNVKRAAPLSKLLNYYCNRLGLLASHVQLVGNGTFARPGDTAEKLGLKDNDILDVIVSATAL